MSYKNEMEKENEQAEQEEDAQSDLALAEQRSGSGSGSVRELQGSGSPGSTPLLGFETAAAAALGCSIPFFAASLSFGAVQLPAFPSLRPAAAGVLSAPAPARASSSHLLMLGEASGSMAIGEGDTMGA